MPEVEAHDPRFPIDLKSAAEETRWQSDNPWYPLYLDPISGLRWPKGKPIISTSPLSSRAGIVHS